MHLSKQISVITTLLALALFAGDAQAGEAHGKVETKITPDHVAFVVIPASGLVVNNDGPWSLSVEQSGKQLAKLGRDAFDEKLPGFNAKLKTTKGSTLNYTMVAFICTADKRNCYRDVFKGDLKF